MRVWGNVGKETVIWCPQIRTRQYKNMILRGGVHIGLERKLAVGDNKNWLEDLRHKTVLWKIADPMEKLSGLDD
jgi:hypothetical protein